MDLMSVLRVACGSCSRGWYVAGSLSVYFQLDLLSHPCPYCEAYALSCTDDSGGRRPGRRRAPEERSPGDRPPADESG
jgi:hypothetical protein